MHGFHIVPGSWKEILFVMKWAVIYACALTAVVVAEDYRIGAITDLDAASAEKPKKAGQAPRAWDAFLEEGVLSIDYNESDPGSSKVEIKWDPNRIHKLHSGFNYAGRGMELSTLTKWNDKVYACDDKTGIVFELPIPDDDDGSEIIPVAYAILADGNFEGPQGFKCEWATIKDDSLYIGGHGKVSPDKDPDHEKWVKRIDSFGLIEHLDWRDNFAKLAAAVGIQEPGYLAHESGAWSDDLNMWVFMPRRISTEKFSHDHDGISGSDVVMYVDENFDYIDVHHVGKHIPTHGFASFKFVPNTEDRVIMAIKTVEIETPENPTGICETYIMVFTPGGEMLYPETKFSNMKFEGIEFL